MTEETDDTSRDELPGSDGEHYLQAEFGTSERADRFYENTMQDELTDRMQDYLQDRFMFFLGTADEDGETDVSPRFGPQGFVRILDDGRSIAYPEFRGNGVHASLGNILENPHVTLMFLDWWTTSVGLHVNGTAELRDEIDGVDAKIDSDRTKTWVVIDIEEAYIHCAKHIPKLKIEQFDPWWGTDDDDLKKTGFFTDEADD